MGVFVVVFLFATFMGCSEKKKNAMSNEKIKLVVAAGAVGQELSTVKNQVNRYMELYPNVEVQVLDTPDLSTDRLGVFMQTFASQSDTIDIMQIDVIWPGDLKDHLINLNDYGAEQYSNQHFTAMISNNTVNGKLLAMPFFADAGLMYYRTDLLEEYGIANPPRTWDELEKIAQMVQIEERKKGNEDFWGFIWQGDAYEGLTCDVLEWIHSNNGGSIISPVGEITINNPNAAEAIDRASNWVGSISPKAVLSYGEEDGRTVFQSGNAMFLRSWPYVYSLAQAEDSVIKGKFNVIPVPHGKGKHASTLGGWQLAVSKYSKHPQEAANLVFFMTNKEEQKNRAIEGSFQPTIESLYQDEDVLKVAPFFKTLFDTFSTAVPRPSNISSPNYADVSRIVFTNVHDALSGKISGEEAVKIMATEIEKVLQ